MKTDLLWFDSTCSETQGKVLKPEAWSLSLPPPPVLSSHELVPAGSLWFQATLPSIQVCSLVLPAEPSVSVIAWNLLCCGQLLPGDIDGIKTYLPGPGHWLSADPYPASTHWISKKCQAAPNTLPSLQPVHRFHFLHPFWSFPQKFGRVRFCCLCPAHSLDT